MADAGKNRRKQLEVLDDVHGVTLSVDSVEEQFFVDWLCEAAQLSIVQDFMYQPRTFVLSEGEQYTDVDGRKRCLFKEHVYSPDFLVAFDPTAQKELAREFKTRADDAAAGQCSAWIDTKGLFNPNARSFSIDRKWVWQKFGIYICEVVPKKFFKKMGCPFRSFYSGKTKKPRKMFQGFCSIKQAFKLS